MSPFELPISKEAEKVEVVEDVGEGGRVEAGNEAPPPPPRDEVG